MLKLAFIYKEHGTLRYVMFLYTKIQTIRKKQDVLRYVFIYQNMDTLRYAIFHWIFEIGGGRGTFFYAKNNALCVEFLYPKKMHLTLHFNTKILALCIKFSKKKTIHFALRFYI